MPQTTLIDPANVKTKAPAATLCLSVPYLIMKNSAHGLVRKDK